jgi:hypothetical protein
MPYLAVLAIAVGMINFIWFFVESAGTGDGLNGFVRDGHYYVSAHSVDTEVSQTAWEWSRAHATSVLITHPIAMVALFYFMFRFVMPRGAERGAGSRPAINVPEVNGPRYRAAGVPGSIRASDVVVSVILVVFGVALVIPDAGPLWLASIGVVIVVVLSNIRRILGRPR